MTIIKRADAIQWIKEHPQTTFEIKFKKVDGTLRLMKCQTGVNDGTLVDNPLKRGKPKPEGVIGVYDMDKKQYRSFNIDSLMSIKMGENSTDEWVDIEESRIVSGEQTK